MDSLETGDVVLFERQWEGLRVGARGRRAERC